jgi:hypothetical protein
MPEKQKILLPTKEADGRSGFLLSFNSMPSSLEMGNPAPFSLRH